MIVSLQSLTLKCIVRVFSLKSLLTISWVMWAYIVCVKNKENTFWNHPGIEFHGSLASWPTREVTPENQLDIFLFSFQACASHVAFRGLSTRIPIASKSLISLSSQFFTKLSYSTLTLNLINIHGNYLTKYNQIWHIIKANKNTLVNHNFTQIIKSISIGEGK